MTGSFRRSRAGALAAVRLPDGPLPAACRRGRVMQYRPAPTDGTAREDLR
jgi:hypothetical protein